MAHKTKEERAACQKIHRDMNKARRDEYLRNNPCVDCGYSDIRALDFDHIDPKTKFKSVARMFAGHYGWATIFKEIQKCEVRCSNCHRIRTLGQIRGPVSHSTSNRALIE